MAESFVVTVIAFPLFLVIIISIMGMTSFSEASGTESGKSNIVSKMIYPEGAPDSPAIVDFSQAFQILIVPKP